MPGHSRKFLGGRLPCHSRKYKERVSVPLSRVHPAGLEIRGLPSVQVLIFLVPSKIDFVCIFHFV